jgi:hypothetical protein
MTLVSFYRTPPEHCNRIRTQDTEVVSWNPAIKGLDKCAELIGPAVIANLSTLMSRSPYSSWGKVNEFKNSDKPDGLYFVQTDGNRELRRMGSRSPIREF